MTPEVLYDVFEALYAQWVKDREELGPYMVGLQAGSVVLIGTQGNGNYRVTVEDAA